MNRPPEEHTRIPHEKLHAFVSAAAQTVGLPEDRSELLARLGIELGEGQREALLQRRGAGKEDLHGGANPVANPRRSGDR